MRHTSYIPPYPVIDRKEKIRVKTDLQRLEFKDNEGYYEEVRNKLKLVMKDKGDQNDYEKIWEFFQEKK